jgi:putative membrane protein
VVKLLTTLAIAVMAVPAVALAEPPAKHTTAPSEMGAPLEGANSFTENQARKRIADAGFTEVGALKKDDKGIWRTVALKDGASVSVSVDFKGNITTTDGR